jgi:single-stranded-DNA-specific exonuclease
MPDHRRRRPRLGDAQQLNEINLKRREIEAEMQDTALLHLDAFRAGRQQHDQRVRRKLAPGRDRHRRLAPEGKILPADDHLRAGRDGWIKGSGRSIPGFHLRDALDLVSKRVPGLIDKFGGHAMAAGLTIKRRILRRVFAGLRGGRPGLADQQATRARDRNRRPARGRLLHHRVHRIDGWQVWGQGFAPPVFCDEFRVLSQRILKERHLKLLLEKNGGAYDAIWFGHTALDRAGRDAPGCRLPARCERIQRRDQGAETDGGARRAGWRVLSGCQPPKHRV